jgi:hypothetical protein
MCHRVFANSLNAQAAQSYIPYQDLENKQMLTGFLETPERFKDHIRRYTYSLTAQLVFGFRTTDLTDPKLLQLYDGFERWSQLMGRALAVLIDVYPLLRLLPDFLLPMRKYAKGLHQKQLGLFLGHWNNIKKKILTGTDQVSASNPIHKLGLTADLAMFC